MNHLDIPAPAAPTSFLFDDHELRAIEFDGAPWFVAVDVARVLGYSESAAMVRTLDEDERHTLRSPQGIQTRNPNVTIISESGLYSAIIRSRVEGAHRFKRWVTHEVLPAIRRHGAYMTDRTIEEVITDPDTIIRIATELKAERAARSRAEQQLEAQTVYAEALKPRATAWDEFLSTTGDSSVNEAAKALSRKSGRIIGEKRLRALLEQWHWIYRDGRGRPRAYQAQIDTGRLAERTRFHYHPESGEKVVDAPQVRVTAKGLDAIRDRLSKETAA